jgi:hypothetical protein
VIPERLLDTRSQIGYTDRKPTTSQVISLKVTGVGNTKVPVTATAVILNITGTEATGDGFVTVWPCDVPQPIASNLNLFAGLTTPNLVAVRLSTAGTVCLYNEPGAHLLADVAGYFAS